jgi:hypothetical protein
MEEDRELRRERQEMARLQLEAARASLLGQQGAGLQNMPYRSPYPAVPPSTRAVTPPPHLAASYNVVPLSSPISGSSGDTRAVVKLFFEWLIAEQPEEDQDDYKEAKAVAVNQKWTVNDLREMANPSSPLYKVAVGFGLKDGVVRHFREELRRFKKVYKSELLVE